MTTLRALWLDEDGGIQPETAILIAFVALAGIGIWQRFGDVTAEMADGAADAFGDENPAPGQPIMDPTPSQ